MPYALAEEQWQCVRSLLPEDLDGSARASGAMRRRRGKIEDAETLLRLLLLHVAGGLSLEQTSLRAREQGLAEVSDVALFKRLRTSEAWLQALTSHVLSTIPGSPLPSLGENYRLRAMDATFIQEPGSTGTDWRLHYSLRLPELVCDFFELTDAHEAEHLRRLPVKPGDVVLADRGYSRRSDAAAILQAGGELVLRLRPSGFPLQDRSGKPLDLLAVLERDLTQAGQVLEVPVQFEYEGQVFQARLCAVRKSAVAIEATRRKVTYESARKRGKLRAQTLAWAAYVCVLTTLPESVVMAPQVLELYRCRWQVELAFKRLKSLLNIGALPKYDPASCRAWMQAKVLTALLTDRLILESELFSPWGYCLPGRKPLALFCGST